MKKLLALSVAACIFSFAASAQTERTVAAADAPQAHGRHQHKHEKGEMMKQLNLTKEQKAQMKVQHKEMKAKKDALKKEDNITVKEMRERRAALKAEQKTKTDAILTGEQKTKMAELKKQKMADRANRPKRDHSQNQAPVQNQ